MKTCDTCQKEYELEDFCQNTKKRWARNAFSDSTGKNICKHCEAHSQKRRYYGGLYHGFGANVSKNPEWLAIPIENRRQLIDDFDRIVAYSFNGNIDSYIKRLHSPVSQIAPQKLANYPKEIRQRSRKILRKHEVDKSTSIEQIDSNIDILEGFLYIMTHSEKRNFFKVGMSVDPERRGVQYDTHFPTGSFEIKKVIWVKDRFYADSVVRNVLTTDGYNLYPLADGRLAKCHNEWFYCRSGHEALEELWSVISDAL